MIALGAGVAGAHCSGPTGSSVATDGGGTDGSAASSGGATSGGGTGSSGSAGSSGSDAAASGASGSSNGGASSSGSGGLDASGSSGGAGEGGITDGSRTADGASPTTCPDGAPCVVCNPLTPNTTDATHGACPAGERCDVRPTVSPPITDVPMCYGVLDSGTQGTPCFLQSDCEPGYACLNLYCGHFCYIGSTSGCPSATSCMPFPQPEYDGTQQLGACQ